MRSLAVPLALAALAAPAAAEPAPPRPGMMLAFSDEFDRDSLARDVQPWAHAFPKGNRWLDRELQVYLDPADAPEAYGLKDGILTIRALPASESVRARYPHARYVSGMLSSHAGYTFQHGYAEIRAKIPAGRGLWPAFWLFGPTDRPYAEIDVMEALGHDPGRVYATIHAGPQWEGRKILQTRTVAEPFSAEFHTYAVDWNEKEVAFYIDGAVTARFDAPPELSTRMHLLVNLAVGGPWGGAPDADTAFPAELQVDYVRVWREPSQGH